MSEPATEHPPATSGTVNVPGFGKVKKKTALYGGLAAVFGVLAVWWVKQRNAAKNATTPGTGTTPNPTVDPAGNTCDMSQINPQTGYCTGSTQDAVAMAQIANASAAQTGSVFTGSGSSLTGTAGFFTNNAEWAQAVYTALNSSGTDALGAAVAAYLHGDPVTTNQVGLIEEAIAIEGLPPVAGSNGYPPSINTGTGTGGGTTPPPPTPPPTPPPPGKPPADKPPPEVTGLRAPAAQVGRTSIGLEWSPSKGATEYQVRVTYQGQVKTTYNTMGTTFTVPDLAPNRTYGLHVVAEAGDEWAPEASITQKTKS